jgi:hypothetical protein
MALYWFKRALETHPDGRIFGFRVLLPHTHSAPYRRVAEVNRNYLSSQGGASGAFGRLLRTYPELKELIDRHVLRLKPHSRARPCVLASLYGGSVLSLLFLSAS